jgi:hypothetical protein
VAICTPNFTHFPIAKALINAGFDVICEKPLTATLEDAVALEKLARESGRFVGVTYTYSGYPMIHEARVRVAAGEIGKIRTVQVEYPLEWMATAIERKGNAQAAWRTDPNKNGRGGSIGDIGTHAYHLAGFVTGLKLQALTADLATFVEGRALDDNAHVLMRYEGGARGPALVVAGRAGQFERRAPAGLRRNRFASSGFKRSPTNSSSRRLTDGCKPSSGALTTCPKMQRPVRGRRRGIRKAISKPSPTFTPASRKPSEPATKIAPRACWGGTSRSHMTG